MTVIPIRASPRTCLGCTHFELVGDDTEGVSSRCALWAEPIDNEGQGDDCPDYEPALTTPTRKRKT